MSRVTKRRAAESRGEGERLDQQRRVRKRVIIGGLIVVGFFGGFIVGFTEAEGLLAGGDRSWPAPLSIGLTVAYLAAMIGGGIGLSRHTDEFEREAQYKAAAAAAGVYVMIYPPWFMLWMADLVREPMHGVLFLVFWVSLALASIFYRFR